LSPSNKAVVEIRKMSERDLPMKSARNILQPGVHVHKETIAVALSAIYAVPS
jgi:hypothetical protein